MRREVSLLALILACLLAGALPRPSFAFNTQNPRWEAPERYPPRQTHKPYRPLHVPPNELPPHQHREIAGIKMSAEERALVDLLTIAVVITAAQWLAASLRLPAGLWLLGFGAIVGPLSGMLDPDSLFGNLLLPLVSIGIAVMLFLDGLAVGQLRFARTRGTVLRLGIVGLVVTWAVASSAATFLFAIDTPPALLLGLAVAVIAPPATWRGTGKDSELALHRLLAAEGAVVRVAAGAVTGLLLAGTLAGGAHGFGTGSWRVARSALEYGLMFGMAGGALLLLVLWQRWIPEALAQSVPLVLAGAIYTLAELVQPWSGFLAVAAAAVLIGTQRGVASEDLERVRDRLHEFIGGVLLLLLMARLTPSAVLDIGAAGGLFAAVALCARPFAVIVSTVGTRLPWRRRLLATILAPRGALAVGLATLCGLQLAQTGETPAETWAALAMLVVLGSVVACTLVPLVRAPLPEAAAGVGEVHADRVGWPARLRGRG